ncbi:hypothetical protein FRB97_002602, partial [Tulasnella sp. 331]
MVVWADEQSASSCRPISAPVRPFSVSPSLAELPESQNESRKPVVHSERNTWMCLVLDRARGQGQKMHAAMDGAPKQLWELGTERTTLAEVVKGITMKEAMPSK